MSLNIKNEHTHALVRELARMSGVSQTQAVADAVSRRLEQLRAQTESDLDVRIDRVMEIAQGISSRQTAASFEDVNSWLYDENGLPK